MMNREEIEARLGNLPSDVAAAIAVRAASRVLPLLAARMPEVRQGHIPFAVWKAEQRSSHLLALLLAQNAALFYILDPDHANHSIDYPTATAASSAAHAALDAADTASTDYAVATAAFTAAAAHAAHAAHTAYIACTSAAKTGNAMAVDAIVAAYAAVAAYAWASADGLGDITRLFLLEIVADLTRMGNGIAIRVLLGLALWSNENRRYAHELIQHFKTDLLSLDAGFEVWVDWYDERFDGNPIDIASLHKYHTIPPAILEQGPMQVNAYLSHLKNDIADQPLNRVRVIFLGYGDAGKTSLIRALFNEPIRGSEPMTPGIEIREWSAPDSGVKAMLWDFGGQVMVHATHQLFLRESCLYVLVISTRNEINSNDQAEYWLEHVKIFGKNAPVIIIGNKVDQSPVNLDMATLHEKYPNIVNFHAIACTQAQGKFKLQFDSFKQGFCQQLQTVGTHQIMLTAAQTKVLTSLRQLQSNKALLSEAEYLALCNEHGVGEDGIQNRVWLLDVLDKLGIIIHFPELPLAADYVFNPRWLTYGVYKLMYSARARLTAFDVVKILGSEEVVSESNQKLAYQPSKCLLIMTLMREFKLCYVLPGQSDTFIIPALLPPNAPLFEFDKANSLAFSFVFQGFLPRHILQECIVNRHAEIVEPLVWQLGVCFSAKTVSAKALLEVDYHLRTLSIWVFGNDARDYLMLLRDEVNTILARLDIHVREMITLTAATRIAQGQLSTGMDDEQADFRQIQAAERFGRNEYISASESIYDVSKILQRFLPDALQPQSKRHNQIININGSIIHGNVTTAEVIQNSFNHLAASPSPDDVKLKLQILLDSLHTLHAQASPAQQSVVNDMLSDTQMLIAETARPAPRKNRILISLDGILEIAQKLGPAWQPVCDAVKALNLTIEEHNH